MSNKITLTTDSGAKVEIERKRVLCNDVTLPWDYNPHNVGLWLACNEFGTMGASWATCEQDALDELCDAGLTLGCMVDNQNPTEEERERLCPLGNAGELHDLDNVAIEQIDLDACGARVLCEFAEARGACADTLDEV